MSEESQDNKPQITKEGDGNVTDANKETLSQTSRHLTTREFEHIKEEELSSAPKPKEQSREELAEMDRVVEEKRLRKEADLKELLKFREDLKKAG